MLETPVPICKLMLNNIGRLHTSTGEPLGTQDATDKNQISSRWMTNSFKVYRLWESLDYVLDSLQATAEKQSPRVLGYLNGARPCRAIKMAKSCKIWVGKSQAYNWVPARTLYSGISFKNIPFLLWFVYKISILNEMYWLTVHLLYM